MAFVPCVVCVLCVLCVVCVVSVLCCKKHTNSVEFGKQVMEI